ncbi:MAG TPA: alpha/beta fold hydrolase [Pinirhizobacter sp.]|uniref:alpha/beta fold hydrolase n=1 Tax=Pinirhizobacter sp. TaxID=2950432 RepID=UPI002C335C31|nr:alpha/beta fold hydrolase [Pinirhizobacter sp.]HMH67045.1 alpha/beta fold hydrolase [Pinirhizobacter sp.]
MLRRTFVQALAASLSIAPFYLQAKEAVAMPNAHFADVNGQHLFYQKHGTGKPLILLHGGGPEVEAFAGNVAGLAKGRQVIAPHLQGHGRTPDTDRPLRCEFLADDIAALIRHLNIGKADVAGYSLGGGVAIQLAIRHPDVIDRLVVLSTVISNDGWYPEGRAAIDQMEANAPMIGEHLKASPVGKMYPGVDWTKLFRKTGEMMRQPFDWSAGVRQIKARTLLVFADADAVRLEHIVEFYKLLGGGQRDAGIDGSLRAANQLAIVPNTTHYNLAGNPLITELVNGFLGANAAPR